MKEGTIIIMLMFIAIPFFTNILIGWKRGI